MNTSQIPEDAASGGALPSPAPATDSVRVQLSSGYFVPSEQNPHAIPEEAVEAAARAVFLSGYPEGCGVSWSPNNPRFQAVMRDIRIALEAAAPYLEVAK